MAWTPREVKDQIVEFPNRFKIDGEPHIIEPDFGTVVEPGTPINRAYLQPIEDYLAQVETKDEVQARINALAGEGNTKTVKQLDEELNSHKNESASLDNLGHVKHAVLTATLDTNWSGSAAPYTKTITVSGILATDTPIIDIVMSGTYSTDEARIEAWGYIYRAVTDADSITFYATDKPTVDLPIQIRVVR